MKVTNFMNTQDNNSSLIIPISIETLMIEVHSRMGYQYKKRPGTLYDAFEKELFSILHKRNIYTIDKVQTKHLIMVILNIARKFGVEHIKLTKDLCVEIFRIAAILGYIPLQYSPAEILDQIFAKPTTWVLSDFF